MNNKPSTVQVDTSNGHRLYVLVNQLTQELGTDLLSLPEHIELDNRRRDDNGDPWRWVEYGEKAA